MEAQCDFCDTGKDDWFYPVDSFEQAIRPELPNFIWGSSGVWVACDTCHDLIENDKRHELAVRSVTSFALIKGTLPPDAIKPLYDRIRILHDEFYAMRSGVPTREPTGELAQAWVRKDKDEQSSE